MMNKEECWELLDENYNPDLDESIKELWEEFCDVNGVDYNDQIIKTYFDEWFNEKVLEEMVDENLIPKQINLNVYYYVNNEKNKVVFNVEEMRNEFVILIDKLVNGDWKVKNS